MPWQELRNCIADQLRESYLVHLAVRNTHKHTHTHTAVWPLNLADFPSRHTPVTFFSPFVFPTGNYTGSWGRNQMSFLLTSAGTGREDADTQVSESSTGSEIRFMLTKMNHINVSSCQLLTNITIFYNSNSQ